MDAHALLETLAIVTTLVLAVAGGRAAAALRFAEIEARDPAQTGS